MNSQMDKSGKTAKISLSVSTDELGRFCEKLIKRSRDISKTHDAMITLESFITLFSKMHHGTNEYRLIDELIKEYSEKTRQELLAEKSLELIQAIKNMDLASIARIHTPLSRSGFIQVLEQCQEQLSQVEINKIQGLAGNWLTEARQKAEEASGYPDAFDFKKANIDIEQFQAISDLHSFLINDSQ
ncbi:MAG: hypothetical protein OQK73_12300 [Gammaproteobacteria bacterium]|nr:hypothetical protein [Gammaproteobacteria bacterium]